MQLLAHPDTINSKIKSIDAVVRQIGASWHFRYHVEGIADLILSDPRPPGRADELWKHTCFEAFVRLPDGAYLEYNFAPSGEWAAYRFDDYRIGMRAEPAEIEIRAEAGEDWYELEAGLRCDALIAGSAMGLSAVIEETGARKSYWALAHPDGAPDFHDPACFRAVLTDIARS